MCTFCHFKMIGAIMLKCMAFYFRCKNASDWLIQVKNFLQWHRGDFGWHLQGVSIQKIGAIGGVNMGVSQFSPKASIFFHSLYYPFNDQTVHDCTVSLWNLGCPNVELATDNKCLWMSIFCHTFLTKLLVFATKTSCWFWIHN